jgi:hypothetical protein
MASKRLGRPRKLKRDRRDTRIYLGFTAAEIRTIRRAAGTNDPREWIRDSVLRLAERAT